MSLIDDIKTRKEKNIQTYLNDVQRLFSDYEQERQTTNDYNGRQILELLQNADDAQSKEVQIELDTSKQELIISNKGEPFSKGGFESIMLAHNSPKTNKRLYIGCKGLGFRSILNWANEIEIVSNNCKVNFSQKNVTDCIAEELAEKQDEILQEKKNRNIIASAFCFPILTLPQIRENVKKSNWTTEIIIHYKSNFLDDIKKQIGALSPEVLLFVRNMESLKILIDGNVDEYYVEKEEKGTFFNVYLFSKLSNGSNTDCLYRVFKKSGKLPEEYQDKTHDNDGLYYETAIAIGENFNIDKNYLYSFFRTDIEIPLPCIVHGSFDLNSSRTLINDTKVNDFILRKITRELLRIALFVRNDSSVTSWNSFNLLYLRHPISLSKLSNFENQLRVCLLKASVFPCVDDEYRPLSDVIYYSDEMSSLVMEKYGKYFKKMLKVKGKEAGKSWADTKLSAGKKYTEEYFWKTFDSICREDALSIEARVGLIKLLGDLIAEGKLTNNAQFKISILIDEDEKLIDRESRIYTPAPKKINTPSFMDIRFIARFFYKRLLESFNISGEHSDRQLCSKISTFANLRPYDFAELTPAIIRKSNEIVKESANSHLIVQETIDVLYHNHVLSQETSDGAENKYEGVLLVNRKKKICSPEKLYFSNTYENGNITESVYGSIIPDDEYLVDKEFWGIKDDDQLESFFRLLGVSKCFKYERFQLSSTQKNYYDLLLKGVLEYQKYSHIPNNYLYQLTDLPKIEKLSPSMVVLLLRNEPELLRELLLPSLKFDKKNHQGKYDVSVDYSFVAFQLKKMFEGIVANVDDKDIDILIDDSSRIDYAYLEKNEINREKTDETLHHLYTKKDLSELDTKTIYGMLKKVPQKFPNERNVQKIYNRILDILKYREITEFPQGLFLACHVGEKFDYKLCKDIFYYDDAILPKSILQKIPTLVLRQRAGCDNVVKVFGVHKLTADALEINDATIEENVQQSTIFEKYLKKHWACILAYRLIGINDSKKKEEETRHLVNLKIHLISNGRFTFDGKTCDFEDFDFISKGNDAYIKTPALDFELLVKKREFLDACAEILMMQFRLDDTKLKSLFRDSIRCDAEEREKEICNDYKFDYLRECKELLGVNETPETIFWNRILNARELPLFTDSNTHKMQEYVERVFSIVLPFNYNDVIFFNLQNEAFIDLLRFIENEMQISLSCCLRDENLLGYHKQQIANLILDYIDKFVSLLWKKINSLSKEDKESRINFKSDVWKFRTADQEIDFSNYAFKLEVDYKSIVLKYAQDTFGINLNQDDPNPYHEEYLYELPDGDETDLPKDLAGLVYFEGYDSLFQDFMKDSKKEAEENEKKSGAEEFVNTIEASFAAIEPSGKDANLSQNERSSSHLPHNHSPKVARIKQEHGKSAQRTVVQWLDNNNIKYHKRYSTSQAVDKDDSAHFDIEYKPDEQSEWRLLEVKHVSHDSFEITNSEITHACKPENQRKYDLALVKDGCVYIIKAPFANETKKSFIEKYKAVETGYTVRFKLIEEKKQIEKG